MNDVPPRVLLVLEPSAKTEELLEALERSGMRRLRCEGCGCEVLTRGTSNMCPPCRKGTRPAAARVPGRCICTNYCNALRAGGFAGPLCSYCDSVECAVRAWGAGRS